MNAKRALEQSGQIPQGTSDADYAEMKQNFNQQAGTAAGQTSVSLGPDGQATQGKTNAVMPSGSTMAGTTFGAGGPGVQNLNGAWGKGSFDSDGHGGTNLTSASVNGMSPMALAEQNAHINTEKAAHVLGTNESWDKMRSQLKSDGHTSAESRTYGDKLANVAGSEWGRVINDKSSFANRLTQAQQKQLQAFGGGEAGVNIGIKAEAGGRYVMTATGDEGKILSFSVDESTANSIKEAESNIRERAITETFGDSKGLQFATNLANKIGASEAASYMKEASNMTRTTETTGADATTAFVGWYASDRYGSDSPENIDKAGAALNHMATGGAAGMNQLQSHQQRFLKSGNYTWGDGQVQANATINATRSEVGGGITNVQGQVAPGATVAGNRTDSINSGGFSGHPGDNHDPLVTPQEEGNLTLTDAEDLRESHNKDFEEFRMLPKTGSPE